MAMKEIDLRNRCGACKNYLQINDTASGGCLRQPYGEDVVHDPLFPYRVVARSRKKCLCYEERVDNG